jgi:hypothetical protein
LTAFAFCGLVAARRNGQTGGAALSPSSCGTDKPIRHRTSWEGIRLKPVEGANDMIRNILHALSAAGLLWLAPAQARAEDSYPSHNITMVVSYTPGGITDTLARIAAEAIQNGLKQTVVVENRAGAGGLIGNSYVARSAPDGYTLLTAPTAFGIQPFTYKKLPYDTLKDFAPVSLIGQSATVMVVSPKLGCRNSSIWPRSRAAISAMRPTAWGRHRNCRSNISAISWESSCNTCPIPARRRQVWP